MLNSLMKSDLVFTVTLNLFGKPCSPSSSRLTFDMAYQNMVMLKDAASEISYLKALDNTILTAV